MSLTASRARQRRLALISSWVVILALTTGVAHANHVSTLALTPASDSSAVGTCNDFTISITPASAEVIDVRITKNGSDVGFCDPSSPAPATGTADTAHTEFTTAGGQRTFGVYSTGTGSMTITAFAEENSNNKADGNEKKDSSTNTWTAGGTSATSTVNCQPDSATNPEGTLHSFSCTPSNSAGNTLAKVPVSFDVTAGPNAEEVGSTSCGQTGNSGSASCSYTDAITVDSAPGTDTITGYVDKNGNGLDSSDPKELITKTWQKRAIDCSPDSSTGEEGTTHSFTCTVTNSLGAVLSGVPVRFDVTGGPNQEEFGPTSCGSTDALGRATCSYLDPITAGSPPGTDTIVGYADQTGSTAADSTDPQESIQRTWTPRVSSIACSPNTSTKDEGATFSFGCTAANAASTPIPGAQVKFTVSSGPNSAGPANCSTTNSSGVASCSYTDSISTTSPPGTDTIVGFFDRSGNGLDTGDPQDTITVAWAARGLGCNPKVTTVDEGTTETFTCTLNAASGSSISGVPIRFEVTGGPNLGLTGSCGNTGGLGSATCSYTDPITLLSPPGTDTVMGYADQTGGTEANSTDPKDSVTSSFQARPTNVDCSPETSSGPEATTFSFTCVVTNQAGTTLSGEAVRFDITAGPNAEEVGSTSCGTTDSSGTATCSYTDSETAGSPPGTDTVVGFVDRGPNGLDSNDPQDSIQRTWTPKAGAVDCTPESTTRDEGDTVPFTFTCLVTNSGGVAITGIPVMFDVTAGPNNEEIGPTSCGNTDGTGHATCSYTDVRGSGSPPGTDNVVGYVDQSGGSGPDAADPQDSISVTWSRQARIIDCLPKTASNPSGTQHTVTCTVTDRFAQPVSGVTVPATESGPGSFISSATQTTNASGQASFTTSTTTAEGGTETITASLPGNRTDTQTEECERPADQPTGAPAGVCQNSVTKIWIRPSPSPSPTTSPSPSPSASPSPSPSASPSPSPSESPSPSPSPSASPTPGPTVIRIATSITAERVRHNFRGRVRSAKHTCEVRRMVVLKKAKKGNDPTVARTKTNSRGRWKIHKARANGRYYSIAKSKTLITLIGLIIQCLPDRSQVLRV